MGGAGGTEGTEATPLPWGWLSRMHCAFCT